VEVAHSQPQVVFNLQARRPKGFRAFCLSGLRIDEFAMLLINNLMSCDGVGTNVLWRELLRANTIEMVCRPMWVSLVGAQVCAPFRQYLHRRLIASPRQWDST
jgi:hypothetical protein